MRRKIFDGGDLKIWQIRGFENEIVKPFDLMVVVKGKDVSKSVKSVTININANEAISYTVVMYTLFERTENMVNKLKEKLKKDIIKSHKKIKNYTW